MDGAIAKTKIFASFLLYFEQLRKVVATKNLWIIPFIVVVCHLSNPAVWAQEIINSGQCLDGNISSPGSIDTFRFYGDAGDAVVIVATKTSGDLYPQVFLYAPSGTREATTWNYTQARIDNHQLAETGWYTIEVEDLNGDRIGDFDLCLTIIPPPDIERYLYLPVAPCRIVDTRKTSAGIIRANSERDFRVYGSVGGQGGDSSGCSSPFGEPYAAHLNMVAVNPTGKGNLQAFPIGAGTGTGLSVNYNTIDTNLANAGSVKTVTGSGPDISVASNFSSAHTVIDVLGYYYSAPPD